jgi:hypothetical protein
MISQFEQNICVARNAIAVFVRERAPAGEVLASKRWQRGPNSVGSLTFTCEHFAIAGDGIFSGWNGNVPPTGPTTRADLPRHHKRVA